jgi:hypothetical protein
MNDTDLDGPLGRPEPTAHPVDVGQRTEAAIVSILVRLGYRVLLPFGVNQRYDVVIDTGERFIRCQCKTGRLRGGVVTFPTRSTQSNTKRTTTSGYVGDADLFLVFCPETERIYAVRVEESTAEYISLRVDPARNNQEKGIRWARDYELPG